MFFADSFKFRNILTQLKNETSIKKCLLFGSIALCILYTTASNKKQTNKKNKV